MANGSRGGAPGRDTSHKPLLPLHIDAGVFQSQKYAMSNPAEIYSGIPLVEKDLETNLMINFVRHGAVSQVPTPEMSMGFLEPKSQDSQGIQRKIGRCIRSASALRARGEVEAALAEYTQMLKSHPHDYDLVCSLGTMLCRVGETAVAVKALSKACQCRPSSAVAHYNLGCAHVHHILRQPSKVAPEVRAAPALRAFDACIAIAPTSEAFAARALCKRHAGDFLGATADYNTSKTARSAHALSIEVAPQLHRAWKEGATLLASTVQVRKDADKEMLKFKSSHAQTEAERKQRVLRDLFVDPLKNMIVKSNNSESDDDDAGAGDVIVAKDDAGWASDSSSSDEEGRTVAAVVEEDYLQHYSSVTSATANSLDATVLVARSNGIQRLESGAPGAPGASKNISRLRDRLDSVATLSQHQHKLHGPTSSVTFSEAEESPRSPSSAAVSLLPASDTVKRIKARKLWGVCRQFMRLYGPVAVPVQRRTHHHTAKIVTMIKRFEFLNKLPPYVLQQIAQCVKPRTFECNDMIIRQGSAGTSLFILMMGNVDVLVHFGDPKQAMHTHTRTHACRHSHFSTMQAVLSLAKRVAGFAVGQAFGETAFTSAAPRSAFCVAVNSVVAAELLKEDFDRIKKGCFARLSCV